MQTVADLIVFVLTNGPRSGFEITRALEDEHRLLLRGREGAVYAALLELERAGLITSEVVTRENGRDRRVYDLPVLEDISAKAPSR